MARRFVIVGLSRLTVRVAQLLAAEDPAEIVVLAGEGDPEPLAPLLPGSVRFRPAGTDLEEALRDALAPVPDALLALADDDRANLRAAVAADGIAPGVPLVIRAFDPVLAARLEHGSGLRRAYSVSGLAAPAFVAAGLADRAVHTLRLGDAEVPLVRLRITPRSPMSGVRPATVLESHAVTVAARDGGRGEWRPEPGTGDALADGEEVLAGGELHHVLRLAVGQADLAPPRPSAERDRRTPRRAGSTSTLVPWVAGGLVLLLLADVVVFSIALGLGPIDALYFAITTAFGDPGLAESDAWLKAFGVSSMIAGGAMVGVLFTQLASVATANRLEARMGRRARRMRGHAVVVGLGTVGYRIERLLFELGIPTVVLERDAGSRFADAVADRTPVLVGDVRLLENLERAGAQRAAMLFACTDDDLTNIGACLQARRLNPSIRTVARVFDDVLAERGRTAFDLDAAISASQVAAAAFAGAATDAFARRTFDLDGGTWVAVRWMPGEALTRARIASLAAEGIRILAWADAGPGTVSGEPRDGLGPSASVVLTGPKPSVDRLLAAS